MHTVAKNTKPPSLAVFESGMSTRLSPCPGGQVVGSSRRGEGEEQGTGKE